jgi:hypothetical protein
MKAALKNNTLCCKKFLYPKMQCCRSRSGPFWSDPDVWDRIRILALINDPISTFFGVCKSHKYLKKSFLLNFLAHEKLFRAYFGQKNFQKKLVLNFIRVRIRIRNRIRPFLKVDPDPVKNRPDPQHCQYGSARNIELVSNSVAVIFFSSPNWLLQLLMLVFGHED